MDVFETSIVSSPVTGMTLTVITMVKKMVSLFHLLIFLSLYYFLNSHFSICF